MSSDLDPWQFVIQESSTNSSIGPFELRVGGDLPVCEVKDSAGNGMGVLLGFPLDLDNRCEIGTSWTAPTARSPDLDIAILTARQSLGGMFLWLVPDNDVLHVYPDCSAQIPVVVDRRTKRAGSTAHALLSDEEYDDRFQHDLYRDLGVEGMGWLPAGLTAHQDIERVLPNHAVELPSLAIRRLEQLDQFSAVSPDEAVSGVVDVVKAQIDILLTSDRSVAMGLTAGYETRVLASCARPHLSQIDFVTIAPPDSRLNVDIQIAERIASEQGLNHRRLERRTATPAQTRQFVRRGGHCYADNNARYFPSTEVLDETHVLMGGLGGEVARGFFWQPDDDPDTSLDVDQLISRMGLPSHHSLRERLDRWQFGLSSCDSLEVLDLLYLENRMGAWYGPQFPCAPTMVRYSPMLTDRAVQLMLGLPPSWKRTNRLGTEIIERCFPELLAYPFNSLGPVRDTLARLRRITSNPTAVATKLRKMRSRL